MMWDSLSLAFVKYLELQSLKGAHMQNTHKLHILFVLFAWLDDN